MFNKHAKNQENIPSLRPSDGKLCLDKCPTTTVSGKNAKCTEALPECYETLHIHSMCQNGFPCKNSSGDSFPKSRGLRSRSCRALNRARRCQARTQNAPRPCRNATKLCTSILCVQMGVHAKIHREIHSLSRVASVPVLENRSLRKFVIYSSGVGKFQFWVGGLLILCLTSMRKIKRKKTSMQKIKKKLQV